MNAKIIELPGDGVEVEIIGSTIYSEFIELLQKLNDASRSFTALLFNMEKAMSLLSLLECYESGKLMVQLDSICSARVAFLKQNPCNGLELMIDTAYNRGLNVQLFASRDLCFEWMRDKN